MCDARHGVRQAWAPVSAPGRAAARTGFVAAHLPPVTGDDRVQPDSVQEWREWLAAHHTRPTGVWLVTWRAGSRGPKISYEESVEQALCFGWVDSKGRTLDAERTMLWFAPRRARSGWARTNKQRIERLTAAGARWCPPGSRWSRRRRPTGRGRCSTPSRTSWCPTTWPPRSTPPRRPREHWEAFPRSVRRAILEWIVQARRPETRARRVAETAEKASRNERANRAGAAPRGGLCRRPAQIGAPGRISPACPRLYLGDVALRRGAGRWAG